MEFKSSYFKINKRMFNFIKRNMCIKFNAPEDSIFSTVKRKLASLSYDAKILHSFLQEQRIQVRMARNIFNHKIFKKKVN